MIRTRADADERDDEKRRSASEKATPGDAQREEGWALPEAPASIIALVVAGLAAVGLSGDLLGRAMRNYTLLSIISALSLAGVVALLQAGRWWRRRERRRVEGVKSKDGNTGQGLVIFLAVMALAVLGIASASAREQPRSVISAAEPKNGIVEISVDSSGSGLQSDERMLVVITALQKLGPLKDIDPNCPSPPPFFATDGANGLGDGVQLVSSQEFGPDTTGKVIATSKVQIADTYSGVCVYSVMQSREHWLDLPWAEPEPVRSSQAFFLFTYKSTERPAPQSAPVVSPAEVVN